MEFVNLRDAGDPGQLAEAYNREGADELVMLDISASSEGRATLMDTVHRVAERLFIPLTVGGGVRALADARRLLAAGADKVAVNTAAVEAPDLVEELAEQYGCQAIVVAIDARRIGNSKIETRKSAAPDALVSSSASRVSNSDPRWQVLTYGGTRETGLDAVEWAKRAESLGAGEILLTSMDADGTRQGFDCELTRAVSERVHIPVVASGGAGSPQHFAEVFLAGRADAALAASIFHFGEHSLRALKEFLSKRGIPVQI